MEKSVDYVFPYVNPNDKNWLQKYQMFSHKALGDNVRFRDNEFLKYVFRGIEKNIPFIRKVHLLVDSKSQVPEWLNQQKVHIVEHKDFIISDCLPTFNSCTIEMFLKNIPDLSEKFIYGNDDFYFLNPCDESDFFSGDLPKFYYRILDSVGSSFKRCVKNTCNVALTRFPNQKILKPGQFLCFSHGPQPLTLSICKETYKNYKTNMIFSATMFRDNYKNLNQYIYPDYAVLSGKMQLGPSLNLYTEMSSNYSEKIESILKSNKKCLCVNDTGRTEENYIKRIAEIFNQLFPEKSSFEI